MFRASFVTGLLVLAAVFMVPVRGVRAQVASPAGGDKPNTLSARDPIPPKPATGLLDEGSVFNGEDGPLVAADIEDFGHRVGMPIFVVTANYIFGETVDTFGEKLVTEWMKGQPGVVLLFERGSGRLNYSASRASGSSSSELRTLFTIGSRAAALMPEDATTAQRIRQAVQAMAAAGETWQKTGRFPDSGAPAKPSESPASPVADEPRLPEKPADFVIDSGDAFDPDAEKALKAELVRFHAKYDMDLYVVTNTWLHPTLTATGMAEELARMWLEGRYGCVIVLNRGTGTGEQALAIAGTDRNDRILPPSVMTAAVNKAREQAAEVRNSPGGSVGDSLRTAARVMMDTFIHRGEPARAELTKATTVGQWHVMTGMAAALFVGSLLLYLFHRLQERIENRSNEQFLFPDVTVDRRFGAAQGGGEVAGIRFGDQEKPEA